MKLKVVQAPNMKKALAHIYEEMGADALIYQTRKTMSGVEVVVGLMAEGEAEVTSTNIDPVLLNDSTSVMSNIDQTIRNLERKMDAIINQSILDKPEMVSQQTKQDDQLRGVVYHDKEIFHKNRLVALVGPTGTGKTTTIIKIAQRFLKENKAEELAIVSTDMDDLCFKNKLSHYCDLYNVDYEFAGSSPELNQIFKNLKDKKLILVDTRGVGQRDNVGISRLIAMLEGGKHRVRSYLTLPCNQQEMVLNEIVKKYRFKYLSGCIFTKVDESVDLTSSFDIVTRYDLPIAYMCNGQDIESHILLPTKENMLSVLPATFNDHMPEEKYARESTNMEAILRTPNFGVGFGMY